MNESAAWLREFAHYSTHVSEENEARILEIADEITLLRDTLQSLANAVGAMRVPQTREDAALQVGFTLGPQLQRAR